MNQPHPPAPSPRRQGGGGNANGLSPRFEFLGFTGGIIALLVSIVAGAMAKAQDASVTDNDVIRVAERMYCPVCENIPLDDCETIACVEWKAEIRAQLEAGASDHEIINSFVARFGDNVVGVPQDPVLRALAIIMPLLATALAIGCGVSAFRRFGSQRKLSLPPPRGSHNEGGGVSEERAGEMSDAAYRRRLEEDLRRRR